MTSPYVYVPPQYPANAYTTAYANPYSPFIPDVSLMGSPYSNPSSLPGSPNLGPVPMSPTVPMGTFHLDPNYVRQRVPSWHGSVAQPQSPFIPPSPKLKTIYPPTHHRRHSFSSAQSAPTAYSAAGTAPAGWPSLSNIYGAGNLSPTWPTTTYLPYQFQIHPWLNGETPRADFMFDLSLTQFLPQKLVAPGQAGFVTAEELAALATNPPITYMRIIIDALPQWPLELSYNPYADANAGLLSVPGTTGGVPPPITFGDVLVAVHRHLQQRISHIDWAKLNKREEASVTRAYYRRCRHTGQGEHAERADGVKRVDFLLKKLRWRGLVRSGEGVETWRLVTM